MKLRSGSLFCKQLYANEFLLQFLSLEFGSKLWTFTKKPHSLHAFDFIYNRPRTAMVLLFSFFFTII